MLPGPWLLLRALLLLGAAPVAPAHQDWTLSASSMGASAPPTEEAPSPPGPNRTRTSPENRHPPAPGTQYTPENRHPPAPGTQYTPENRHPPAPGTQYTPENRHPPAPGTQYTPENRHPPAPGTQYTPENRHPPAPGTQYPPGPSTYLPANPGARIPPEPGGPDTPSSSEASEPWRSGFWTENEELPRTHIPPEPMRTEFPEPARTGAELSTEPRGNETPPAPEKNTTGNEQGMEASRDWAQLVSEPVRTGTNPPSEPVKTGTNPPSEPVKTGTNPPSEPVKTGTNPPSEPVRTGTNPPSEPVKTGTNPPSEPVRTGTNPPSEPVKTGTNPPSEPVRTGTNPPSEPVKTGTNPPSEPVRTGTNPPSEPVKTGTNPPSEPVRTGTNPPSEPVSVVFRTRAEEHAATQTEAHVSTGSEPGGTEQDPLPAAGRTGSVTDVVQGPVMRRHMSKRMSHTDSYLSTTFTRGGDRTLLSVTNVSAFSDITEVPSAYNVDSTPSRNRETVGTTTEDLANRTEPGSGTTLKVSGTSPWGSGSDSGISMPATDPLLTPSYRNSTDSSHHFPDSTVPFTSVPVTAPNITDVSQTSNSSLDLSSPFLSSSSPSSHSSSSTSLSVPFSQSSSSSLPFSVSSNESFLSPEAATFPNSFHTKSSISEVFSSSPIPSTLVFSDQPSATASPSLSDVPPVSVFTRPYVPLTATSAEPVLPVSPITALPTSSSPAADTEATVPSVSSSQTVEPSTATNSSVTGLILHSVRPHVTETAGFDGTDSRETSATFSVTVTLPVGTFKPEDKPSGTLSPVEKTRTPSAATAQFSQPPTLSTDSAPPTTTLHGQFLPTFYDSTQQTPEPDKTTWPGSSKTATSGPGVETTDGGTTSVTPDTLTLGMDSQTSSSTRSHKQGVQTTLSAGTVTTTSSATSIAKPPSTTTTTVTASLCSSGPCQNGGRCTEDRYNKTFRCECPPAWHGAYCSRDVDECLSDPCPPRATCTNTRGSFSCRCPLGYILEKGAGCILVRTFLGHVKMPQSFLNGSSGKYTALHQIEEEIVSMLSSSFSALDGYLRSVVTNSSQTNQITVSVRNVFSLASNVTAYDLTYSLQRYIRSCQSHPERHPGCHLLLHPQLYYIAGSLCAVNSPGCDRDTAECSDVTGVSVCQCKPGYFKFTATDHSCRACEDGYKRENGTCVRCPFGLGGFNCSNPYQLITVIMASAGGGVLLILAIALAVMCCRKNKNDISKLIFKSGDFQMSPYAEYAKTPRSSDWGRETIEMQENGSTKNLLQMTDVYYSPGLRNPELERNGLYPYTGAPGSRHSCIYPGQFNPSFITEENRRRDYF